MLEVPLKEAASLCKKSEKTLRRKIEAGLLEGRKEPLDFGGFMWMIDIDSLDELYPGSRPSHLPQVYEAPGTPDVRLKNRPIEENPGTTIVAQPDAQLGEFDGDSEEDEEFQAHRSFFDYILEENRTLKGDLKNRDARILALNERAFVLERALGAEEGTSSTQARVLDWFQNQEAEREKQRQQEKMNLLTAASTPEKKERPKTDLAAAALAGAGAVVIFLLVLAATGLVAFGI